MCGMELPVHSQTSKLQPLKFGNRSLVSLHIYWVKPYYQKGSLGLINNTPSPVHAMVRCPTGYRPLQEPIETAQCGSVRPTNLGVLTKTPSGGSDREVRDAMLIYCREV